MIAMSKVLFVINDNVYPYRTGGMEIFNYHLIKTLGTDLQITYMASRKYDFDSAEFVRSCPLRPSKLFTPLWLLIYLLFHREYRHIVFSFSAAHWLVWRLYTLTVRLLGLESTVVIHYGKDVPEEHPDVYRDFFSSAKNVIAVSEDIKHNYDKAYGLDCKVVFPLIPFRKASQSSDFYRNVYSVPEDTKVIVMVGSLKQMKNPRTLLEALSLFDKHEMDTYRPHAVYAGGGPMEGELKHFAEANGLSEYVTFLGIVPNDKVCEIMCMADIFLIASDFEGTSVSLLEAMFNAKPVVASDVPGLRDMVESGRNGLLYEVSSAAELKKCLMELLSDADKARKLGMSARDSYNDRYDYNRMVETYKELLG